MRRSERISWCLAGALSIVLGVAGWKAHTSNAAADDRVHGNRGLALRVGALEDRRDDLVAQLGGYDVPALTAEARDIQNLESQYGAVQRDEAAARRAAEPPPFAPPATKLRPVWSLRPSACRDVGQRTVDGVVQTTVWAALQGDTDRVAELIELSPPTAAIAADVFAALPESTRNYYQTPERWVAALVTLAFPPDLPSISVATTSEGGSIGLAVVRFTQANGSERDVLLNARRTGGEWRLALPADFIRAAAAQLFPSATAE